MCASAGKHTWKPKQPSSKGTRMTVQQVWETPITLLNQEEKKEVERKRRAVAGTTADKLLGRTFVIFSAMVRTLKLYSH